MAGIGPAPKPPERRARRSKNSDAGLRVIEASPVAQPPLPPGMAWPEETETWWKMWGDSPLSGEFTQTDWSFLLDTAILHAQLWGNGDTTVLPELRIRVAKFGATPEDRARLRIQFAQAEGAEQHQKQNKVSSRERMKNKKLRVVG